MLNLSSAPTEICGCYFCFNLMTNREVKFSELRGHYCPGCGVDSIMKFSMCVSNGDILIALETKAKQAWRLTDMDGNEAGHMMEKFDVRLPWEK